MEPTAKLRWYDKPVLVNVLLFLFFPVGLFGLWKSNKIATWWKVGGTVLILALLVNSFGTKKGTDASPVAAAEQPLTEAEKKATAEQEIAAAKEEKERVAKEKADNTVSAPVLVATYKENEVRADQTFKEKQFYVTGTVGEIKKDILDKIYITLQGVDYNDVQCYLEDEAVAASLNKGDKVTIKGTCNGMVMLNVLMKECSVVE